MNSRTSAAVIFTACGLAAASSSMALELWRLDCGEMIIDDISFFSDTFDYDGQSATISNGCYLVRNGDRYLMWDLGIGENYLGNTESRDGWTSSISITLADQLDQIGVTVDDIDFIGISHYHGDHIGQATTFANATLLLSEAEAEHIRANPNGSAQRRLVPWFGGGAVIQEIDGDHDVFGDGSVTILAMPGHTPGHNALLVRLEGAGPVLLSGDLYHFQSEVGTDIVSNWNSSRAETLASFNRFTTIIGMLDPIVVVQHDPLDIDKLPAFPDSAR